MLRRMCRFSVRDLLWLTLVVAVGLGWLVRERQHQAKLDLARERATKWRMAAGALEAALKDVDIRVRWGFESGLMVQHGNDIYHAPLQEPGCFTGSTRSCTRR